MNADETDNVQTSANEKAGSEKGRRIVVGRVVSNKMNQGVSVSIERLIKHPVYGKFIRRTSKVLAHDEQNSCKIGDKVAIVECRPISKHKSWRVEKIIETVEAS